MAKIPQYRTQEEVASLIAKAVEAVGKYKSPTIMVKAERALRKASRMEPTDNQHKALRYIQTHGWIPFEETLGMNWTFLGGLFTRGLVEWITKDGVLGVSPTPAGSRRPE